MDPISSQLIYDTLGFKFVECKDPLELYWVYGSDPLGMPIRQNMRYGMPVDFSIEKQGYYLYPGDARRPDLPSLDRYETFINYAVPYLKKKGFDWSCGDNEDGCFCFIHSSERLPAKNYFYAFSRAKTLAGAWQEALLKFLHGEVLSNKT